MLVETALATLVEVRTASTGDDWARRRDTAREQIIERWDDRTYRIFRILLCQYAVQFAEVLRGYGLPVDTRSAIVLRDAAATCPTG
jgi:hypothetical protein